MEYKQVDGPMQLVQKSIELCFHRNIELIRKILLCETFVKLIHMEATKTRSFC